MSLRVTKQQFVSKMRYVDSDLPKTDVKLVEAEYLALERLGFVLVDKKALLKAKEDLEEILGSQLMKDAQKLVGKYVADRWLGQLSMCLEILAEEVRQK